MPSVRAVARRLAARPGWSPVRTVARGVRRARIVADVGSFRRFRLLEDPSRSWPSDAPVPIAVRALGGRSVFVRPGSADIAAMVGTFTGRHHRPPRGIPEARTIWDLGANVGLTIADLAARCPEATIVGVELDDENAGAARRNIEPWKDRCSVRRAAVWCSGGTVGYRRDRGREQETRVAAVATRPANATAPAIDLDTLLAEGPRAHVDYVKMDIEGSEREVLRHNTNWAAAVGSIKVEVHRPYTVAECRADLERLGFRSRVDTRHRALVIGVRPGG